MLRESQDVGWEETSAMVQLRDFLLKVRRLMRNKNVLALEVTGLASQ